MMLIMAIISWIWDQNHRKQKQNRSEGLYQTKKLLQCKGINQQSKMVTYEMETKIFANHTPDQELISTIYISTT